MQTVNDELERIAEDLRVHGFSLALSVDAIPVLPQQAGDPDTVDFPVLHPISLVVPPGLPAPAPGEPDIDPVAVDVLGESLRLLPPGR